MRELFFILPCPNRIFKTSTNLIQSRISETGGLYCRETGAFRYENALRVMVVEFATRLIYKNNKLISSTRKDHLDDYDKFIEGTSIAFHPFINCPTYSSYPKFYGDKEPEKIELTVEESQGQGVKGFKDLERSSK